jgi:ABC-type sugar transport system ATPase subunit
MNAPALECRRITKRFDGVAAVSDVDFELKAGEVHALCGENGAGKSTLIKVLGGIHPYGSYCGELLIGGAPAILRSAADARAAGIAVVYQELALVPEMTVAENIFLGKEPMRGGFIDWNAVFTGAQRVLRQFEIDIDPAARVGDLGVGRRQLVEIVKALAAEPRILILDEPTHGVDVGTKADVHRTISHLATQGLTILLISSELPEILGMSDRVLVMREGRLVAELSRAEATQERVIQAAAGVEAVA